MKKLLLTLALLGSQAFGQALAPTQMSFSYPVTVDCKSSAGVYDSTGALIRTLWSNRQDLAASGTISAFWDGKLDNGTQAAAGNYQIRVLQNNVTYTWAGPIGNTSNSWNDTNNWSQFGTPPTTKLAFVGAIGWMVSGYAEGQYNMGWIDEKNPNSPHILNWNYITNQVVASDIATDGKKFYIINPLLGGGGSWSSVFDATSGMPAAFTNGTALVGAVGGGTPNNGFNNTTLSIIDNTDPVGQNIPSGIAVQRNGQILAIAHGDWVNGTPKPGPNVIRLFDKTTGLATGTNITIPNPQQIAFNSQGLWVISNGTLNLVSGVGTSNTITAPITGLSNAVGVGTNQVNDHVYVLDGGTHQQVKEFDNTGTLVRTYGDLGGYTDNNPTITKTRLCLDQKATFNTMATNGSWVTVEDDGDVWFSDAGTNLRVLHITPNGAGYTYVNRILYTPAMYHVAVNHNDPTRVFGNMFEYRVNYNVPNQPGDPDPALGGNGSWELVANWAVGAGLPQAAGGTKDYALTVETLSNGRTYAQFNGGLTNYGYMAELPNDGTPLRFTGQVSVFQAPVLERDGSLMFVTTTGTAPNLTQTITRQPLTGFDGSGNPQWGSTVNVQAVTANSTTDPITQKGGGMVPNVFPTTGGVYPIFYAQAGTTLGYPHLGCIIQGRSTYACKVNPDKCMHYPDMQGGFPSGDNGPANPCPGSNGFGGHSAMVALTEGRHIWSVYDGQYATWGNSFSDFWEDGLLVGETTQLAPSRSRSAIVAPPPYPVGFAANFGTTMVATVGADQYIYVPTESGFTPIDLWDVSNLSSIHEFGATGALGTSVSLTQIF